MVSLLLAAVPGAIAPECVDAAEVLAGATAQDCKLNAKYAISCAHKCGCRTFTTWEDIVEVSMVRYRKSVK